MIVFFFAFGLFIGSFLNVIIDRLPHGRSFLGGRSECDTCHHALSSRDLVPVLSFLILKGKCRYCHAPLSYQYPLLEVVTGTLFAFSYLFLPHATPLAVTYYLVIMAILIVIFFIDLKDGIIPFPIILPGIVIVLLWDFLILSPSVGIISLITGIISFLFFLTLFLGTRGKGMGFGDVVFAFFMGVLLGFPDAVTAFYVAFLTGAGVGIILILRGKKKLKGSLPFGPFLIAGVLISLFFGNTLVKAFFEVVLR